ncbi:serine/threonine-protein kinase [Streptomyces sp. NPDC051219]|uniref:serine/threonine-protein kinase n=1 Tax=Streptomyces sp. NPDC051219 TaxID=3155283 RepID=UPI0034174261
MGVVWRARDEVLGREVAVKEVRAPAGLPASDEQRMYARLEREAWATARISHRNVVTVYDVASEDGRPWIVMELVRGLSLSEVLEGEGPMPPQRAAHIGAEVLAALRAAHEAGVLHRDVKPGNVLISNDGRVVLTDFGIATVEGSSALTMTGEVVGSPEFLAPERALGRRPGPESDLWSLGVLLYAAVEGSSPFRQDTPLSTLRAVVDEELPPPRRAGPLTPVLEGLLRKDPADRLHADDAERMLRVVGAGGAPRADVPPSPGPYGPTVTSATPPATPRLPSPLPSAGGPATTNTTSTAAQDRPRRAAVVLAAGVLALLLAVGGIAWVLINGMGGDGDNGGTTRSPGGTTGGASGGGDTGSPGVGTPSDSGEPGGASGTPSGNGTTTDGGGHTSSPPPEQTVEIHLQTVRGSFSGACPPPEAEAPAFTATITVGRTPATVEYRWVKRSGETSGGGWKTLTFAAGGGRTQQVNHTELTYKQGEVHRDEIWVEAGQPVEARSGTVEFSVTCEEETPTGGASSYSPDTVTPQP